MDVLRVAKEKPGGRLDQGHPSLGNQVSNFLEGELQVIKVVVMHLLPFILIKSFVEVLEVVYSIKQSVLARAFERVPQVSACIRHELFFGSNTVAISVDALPDALAHLVVTMFIEVLKVLISLHDHEDSLRTVNGVMGCVDFVHGGGPLSLSDVQHVSCLVKHASIVSPLAHIVPRG